MTGGKQMFDLSIVPKRHENNVHAEISLLVIRIFLEEKKIGHGESADITHG